MGYPMPLLPGSALPLEKINKKEQLDFIYEPLPNFLSCKLLFLELPVKMAGKPIIWGLVGKSNELVETNCVA